MSVVADILTTMSPRERYESLCVQRQADSDRRPYGYVRDILPDVLGIEHVWSAQDAHQAWQLMDALDRYGQMFSGAAQQVPIARITAVNQETFLFSALDHYLSGMQEQYGNGKFHEEGYPVLLDNGRSLVLIDGTHRYLAACVEGYEVFTACVVPLRVG